MAEYIDRDAAIELLHYNADETCSAVVSDFEAIPAADINRPTKSQFKRMAAQMDYAPVVHGQWILRHIGAGHYWECSVCHTNPCIYVTENTKFCPNCGARMDGTDGE